MPGTVLIKSQKAEINLSSPRNVETETGRLSPWWSQDSSQCDSNQNPFLVMLLNAVHPSPKIPIPQQPLSESSLNQEGDTPAQVHTFTVRTSIRYVETLIKKTTPALKVNLPYWLVTLNKYFFYNSLVISIPPELPIVLVQIKWSFLKGTDTF